jgi:(S)-2-hydroxyglutarate dehydrogenase
MNNFDVIVIGGGIVGLATAYNLLEKKPEIKILILEKEYSVGVHQTSNNSGVIHSGIYYKPGSQKAINCKQGYDQMLQFCAVHNIAHDVCGKIIVAVNESERPLLDNIYKRGIENGLAGIKKISPAEAHEIEPHVSTVEAVWVPQTGIVNYGDVARKYAELIQKMGGSLNLGEKVLSIDTHKNETIVTTNKREYNGKTIVNCAGLYADKVAKMSQKEVDIQILPFRGEYYELKHEKEYLVKNLIYPVPNPNFPFLGVHFTRMIHGGIEAGPNAVLAFKREGYTRWQINLPELAETLLFPGFRKIATKYWDDGFAEMKRSFSKKLFVDALERLIPEIQMDDVVPGRAGVRAQACAPDGNLIDDFLILEKGNVINVINAPSPAATASLAIGQTIASKVLAINA